MQKGFSHSLLLQTVKCGTKPSLIVILRTIEYRRDSVLAFYCRQQILKQCLEFLKHCSEGYYWTAAVACSQPLCWWADLKWLQIWNWDRRRSKLQS